MTSALGSCGDSCAKWICRTVQQKDLTINLHHVMDFSSCEGFEARMLNAGRTVRGFAEYLDEALRIEERRVFRFQASRACPVFRAPTARAC